MPDCFSDRSLEEVRRERQANIAARYAWEESGTARWFIGLRRISWAEEFTVSAWHRCPGGQLIHECYSSRYVHDVWRCPSCGSLLSRNDARGEERPLGEVTDAR